MAEKSFAIVQMSTRNNLNITIVIKIILKLCVIVSWPVSE